MMDLYGMLRAGNRLMISQLTPGRPRSHPKNWTLNPGAKEDVCVCVSVCMCGCMCVCAWVGACVCRLELKPATSQCPSPVP